MSGLKHVQVFVAGECRFAEDEVTEIEYTATGVRVQWRNTTFFFPVADEIRVWEEEE